LLKTLAVKVKFHYAIQLANQLTTWFTSWSATCYRSARELDSVMEFGLSGAILLGISLLAGRRPARELIADLHLRTGLRPRSSYLDMSR